MESSDFTEDSIVTKWNLRSFIKYILRINLNLQTRLKILVTNKLESRDVEENSYE